MRMDRRNGNSATSIRDVARRANVSPATVSRAFAEPGLVRHETLQRVLAVAEELHYRPSRAARSLKTGKTGNIGVVVPALGNPFFPAILKGAQARAREAGQHAADLVVAAEVTAVVAFNDLMALGVLSRLADRGIGVPN